jgi:hypothetical protein
VETRDHWKKRGGTKKPNNIKNSEIDMKTKLSIFITMTFILSSLIVKAQFPVDQETGKVKFTSVIDLPNTPKEKIYKKAKLWIVSTLKSGDNMVELSGDNSDQIVGTGNLLLDSIRTWNDVYASLAYLNFKFIVFCKDNKYKYSVENLTLEMSYYSSGLEDLICNGTKKSCEEFKRKTTLYLIKKVDKLIADFNSNMAKPETNDW